MDKDSQNITYPNNKELSLVLDRMDQLLLGIKYLFDNNCEKDKMAIKPEKAAGLLLDLCLDSDVYAVVRSKYNKNNILLSFPVFLMLYSNYCGIRELSSTNQGNELWWIPTVNGQWKEVLLLLLLQ
jgi:hypothetical protein